MVHPPARPLGAELLTAAGVCQTQSGVRCGVVFIRMCVYVFEFIFVYVCTYNLFSVYVYMYLDSLPPPPVFLLSICLSS